MNPEEMTYKFHDSFELQMIDTNCNNCFFMVRDIGKFKKWEQHHREEAEKDFQAEKKKAIEDAQKVISEGETPNDRKSGEGMLRIAMKMRFEFQKNNLVQYGHCSKLNKPVHFQPLVNSPQNQTCFIHRKTLSAAIKNTLTQ